MANSKSAEKRIRQNERRRQRNKIVRSRLRTFLNKFDAAVAEGNLEVAEERLRTVESAFDKAASKGIIPRARASRKVGRLADRLNSLRAGQEA